MHLAALRSWLETPTDPHSRLHRKNGFSHSLQRHFAETAREFNLADQQLSEPGAGGAIGGRKSASNWNACIFFTGGNGARMRGWRTISQRDYRARALPSSGQIFENDCTFHVDGIAFPAVAGMRRTGNARGCE
jgi:hypothetical protein